MMKRQLIILVLIMATFVLPAWGLDLKPGKYEITAKVEMPGMPGAMPPQTTTQCLTSKDPVPNTSAGAQGCQITDMKTEGNTVKYTLVCNQQGMQTESHGEMTYKGDTFTGTCQTQMGPAGGGMTITTKIDGKRIGKCE